MEREPKIYGAPKSKDKQCKLQFLLALRKRKMRVHKVMQELLDPAQINPEGIQYRPTPDDLIVIERRKRFRETMESGWFGGMGNN